MEDNKLIVSLSPHIHSGDTVKRNMYGVIVAMIPAFIASVWAFGLGALVVTTVSVFSCVFFEWFITKFLLKKESTTVTDGSAIITGVLLAFNLPSNLPIWIIVIGALFSIGVVKMSFGGLGNNIFNPAIAGRIFLLLSFTAPMTDWPAVGQLTSYIDVETSATPLFFMKEIANGNVEHIENIPSLWNLFIGNNGGSLGEISALAILIGLAYMLVRKVITWHIPITILLTVFIFSGILHLANPTQFVSPFLHIFSGGLLLGAVFMATDYVTSPMSHRGMIIFGVGIGIITVVIRVFGDYPEGMSFAILIMNAFTPLINSYFKPKRFGRTKR